MQRRGFLKSATLLASAFAAVPSCARSGTPPAPRQRADPSRRVGRPPPDQSVDAVVTRTMRLAGVPGVAVGMLQSGDVDERVWGVTDARTGAPLTRDSRFEAASLSKPITAYMALMLVRRGVLDLDRPLLRYGVSPVNPSDARGLRVTARHVLSQSSGWRNWRRASDPPLVADFEPGTRYQYSGEGFVQLQRVVEHLADRGFADLAADLVFGPLGMTRSTFLVTAPDTALVTGHGARAQPRESYGARVGRHLERHAPAGRTASSLRVAEVESLLPTMEPPSPAIPAFIMPNAAGSLVTTAGDYLRFWVHLLTARPGSDASMALGRMMADETPINAELSWGLGIAREEVNGALRLWHHGDNPGFKNFVSVYPARREALVVFTNADSGMRVAERAARALTGHDHGAFAWL